MESGLTEITLREFIEIIRPLLVKNEYHFDATGHHYFQLYVRCACNISVDELDTECRYSSNYLTTISDVKSGFDYDVDYLSASYFRPSEYGGWDNFPDISQPKWDTVLDKKYLDMLIRIVRDNNIKIFKREK